MPFQPLPLPQSSITTGTSKQLGNPDSSVTVSVTCRSCGVHFDLHPDGELVQCPLCGGKNMGGDKKMIEAAICDLNEPILDVSYIKPYFSLKDVRWQVISARELPANATPVA